MNESVWLEKISTLHAKEKQNDDSKIVIARKLSELIEKKILEMAKDKHIGVLYSGGIDSTLICYILHKNNIPFKAVTIGFQDNEEQKLPEDIEQAKSIAKEIGFEYSELMLDFEEVEDLFKVTTSILGKDNSDVINVGVGSVEVAGISYLKSLGCTHIFGGLGSEEIFAGYQRHAESSNVHEECWKGLELMYKRDLIREFSIAEHFNIILLTPFLDDEVISFAMNIPSKFKLEGDNNKIILRDAALVLGLPEIAASRKKRAAQYGSRTDKAILKLSKKSGFSLKKDYLASLFESKDL